MAEPNVFGKRARPTRNAYRAAVANVIRDVKAKHSLSDVDLADRIGCSDDTIDNAEKQRHNLDPVLLLNIEHEFGAGTIDAVLELAGTHGVPEDLAEGGDVLPPMLRASGKIAQARSVDSPGGHKETLQELADAEADLVEARRGINRMLARLRKMRGC